MIPWDSCVLWLGYPLQNGVWPDVSKHDNDGVITGAFWEGDSLGFDGIDDFVDCGNHTSLNITAAITIETLVKPATIDFHGLGAKDGVSNKCWDLYLRDSDPYIFFRVKDASGEHICGSATSYSVNKWNHIVATFNGTVLKIYLNGIEVGSLNWTGSIESNTSRHLRIGRQPYPDPLMLEGRMLGFRLYNKALTAQQVQESYEQTYKLV